MSSKNKESGVEAGCFVVGFGCRERAKEPGFGVKNNRRSNRTEEEEEELRRAKIEEETPKE